VQADSGSPSPLTRTSSPARVLLVHNYYQQRGGEDQVVEREGALLETNGHEVIRYTASNDAIAIHGAIWAAKRLIWNTQVYEELRTVISDRRPQVLHAHNIFPLLSPAVYAAANDAKIPVVQTLHNYRLICANGLLFRDGRVCEDCIGRHLPWPGVAHKCYRENTLASAAVVGMLQLHRAARTWRTRVDTYIALTEFARSKMIAGGLPGAKIVVKPNFVTPNETPHAGDGEYILFVGRLSVEKGIQMLLATWKKFADLPPLKIVGNGPLGDQVRTASLLDRRIQLIGYQEADALGELYRHARAVVFPSQCYEGFPLVIAESYAAQLPVIGSSIGAAALLIEPFITGLHFAPNSLDDLGDKIRWAWGNPQAMRIMGTHALARYAANYAPDVNYRILSRIYANLSM